VVGLIWLQAVMKAQNGLWLSPVKDRGSDSNQREDRGERGRDEGGAINHHIAQAEVHFPERIPVWTSNISDSAPAGGLGHRYIACVARLVTSLSV